MPNEYANVDNCIKLLGRKLYMLLGVANGTDITTNERLLLAIDAANSVVDSYLRPAYGPLPLPGGGASYPAIVQAAVALVRWNLLMGREDAIDDTDRDLQQDAIKYLAQLRDKGGLDITVDTGKPQASGIASSVVRLSSSTASRMRERATDVEL